MPGLTRITNPLLDVLEVFLDAFHEDRRELHGWAIMKTTGRSGPTIYGVLDRLEDAGWVTARWEEQHPEGNKPRRRFYRLTPTGTTEATKLLASRRPHTRESGQQQLRPGWGLGALWDGLLTGGTR